MRARAVDDLQREILPHDTVCIDSKLTRRSRRDPRKYQESRDWTGTEGVGDGGDFRRRDNLQTDLNNTVSSGAMEVVKTDLVDLSGNTDQVVVDGMVELMAEDLTETPVHWPDQSIPGLPADEG